MIQAIQTPFPGNVLLDGNNTTIVVQSSNSGTAFYFRAEIYIDNVLFDTQSWSRKDNFIAEKNLRYLYNAYFNTQFQEAFTNGLVEVTDLKKEVKIIVKEYTIAEDELAQTLELPIFHILFNTNSVLFDDNQTLTVLGLDTNYFQIPSQGTIVIPFFANTSNETISVVTELDTGTILNTETITATTDKKVYAYTFTLPEIAYANLYVKVTITVGTVTKTFIYKVFRNPTFNIKQIVFKNNFGFYIPAYFSGEFSSENNYKVDTYENFDYSETIFNIEQNAVYKINTNYLNTQELPIVNQINNALEAYFKDASGYNPINTATKKTITAQDREHLFNNELNFTFKKGLPLNNNGFLGAPIVSDFAVTGDENILFDITKAQFEAVYSNTFPIHSINLNAFINNGTLRVVFLNGAIEVVDENEYYLWSEIDKFTFISDPNESGNAYELFQYKISNQYLTSNIANLTINITDLPDGNLPPVFSPLYPLIMPIFRIDGVSGSITITDLSVSDPEDDALTITWSLPDAPIGLSITNGNTINPTITADNTAILGQTEVLKVTANDGNGNETESTHYVWVVDAASSISATEQTPVGTTRIFDINIDHGIPNETIDLVFDFDVYAPQQYVSVFSDDLNAERIVNLQNRRQTFTKTFDAQGEINFEITIEDAGLTPSELDITQTNPSGDLIVDKDNQSIRL